jgi:exonuclease III
VFSEEKKRKDRFFARKQFAQLNDLWIDAWRLYHAEAAEYSWYSRHGNGWRIDQVFVSPALRPAVTAAYYLHETRTEGLTDHSALIIELDMALTSQKQKS